MLAVVSFTAPLKLLAADKVFFDLPRTTPCRDVTTAEFFLSNPNERLVEARFQISSLIRSGGEDDLVQFFYRFDCRTPGAEVVGYLPQTTLTSDVAGNVGVQRINEDSKTLGLAVTGAFDHIVSGTGTGNLNSKNTTNIQYDLLPPLEMVAASGTLNRGTGVYFKLKPNSQSSLEGGKEFIVVLRVPHDWRGDMMEVRCQASGYRNTSAPPFEERGSIGGQRFLVALYMEGDEQAKQISQHFATCEQQLRNLAVANRRAIQKQAYPSTAHRFGRIIAVVEPKIPADWLDRVIFAPASADLEEYLDRLPDEVLAAAEQFVTAKRELATLTGQ
jgi:hypothetical protein